MMMNAEILEAVVLGIVQGITEFFPVSSTAHLILFPWFFGWHGEIDTLTFDVALHAGTLAALIACFYRDWIDLLVRDRRMLSYLLLSTIPAGIAGLLLHDIAEHTLRSPLIIVGSLIIIGILMLIAEKGYDKTRRSTFSEITLADALFVGCAQAIALIPGVSRSGITITAGIFRNITREAAARFSFLLSTPVIGGAALLGVRKLIKHPDSYHFDVFAAGFLAALLSGFFAIQFLLRFLRRHPLNVFVYYRFFLAGIIVVALLMRI